MPFPLKYMCESIYVTDFYYSARRNDLNDKEIDLNILQSQFHLFSPLYCGFYAFMTNVSNHYSVMNIYLNNFGKNGENYKNISRHKGLTRGIRSNRYDVIESSSSERVNRNRSSF